MHNNGTLLVNSTAAGKSIQVATSTLYNFTAKGSGGGWSFLDTNATSTSNFSVAAGTMTAPSGILAVGGSFDSSLGTFTHNNGTVKMTSTSGGNTVAAGSSNLNNLIFSGIGGSWTMTDAAPTVAGNFAAATGTVALPTGTLSVGGSFDSSTGWFTATSGTVAFNASSLGKTISVGTSTFYNLTFNSSSGGWTILTSATSTNNTTLTAATSFTLTSGNTLAVGGTFSNSAGAATTWTGSVLYLYSGTNYSINTKADAAETYGTLLLGPSTQVSMWNSSAATTTFDPTASLYSENNANVSGSLYIYGAYTKTTGTDYWSDATDFDGTAVGARQVQVKIATSSSVIYNGGNLNMIGISSATTTIRSSGTTPYTFTFTGSGTLNASYYDFRNMDSSGVQILGTPTVSSLNNGYFEMSAASGTAMTLAGTVIDTNGSVSFSNDGFATTSANVRGYNITLSGAAGNSWTFTRAYGNFAGEAHNSDGSDQCGRIRWDDSSCLFVNEAHYRWRNDDGGEGVPTSDWYNASWIRRQRIQITNSNGTAYTNIPVKINVPYNSNMLANFNDVRFTDSTGTSSINFWRESSTAATSTVWVQIPSLPSSGSATIYMYYGNGSATAADATTTFSYLEDFEDNTLADGWSGDTGLFSTSATIHDQGSFGLTGSAAQTTDGMYQAGSQTAQGKTIRWFQYVDTGFTDEACTLLGIQAGYPAGSPAHPDYAVCLDNLSSGSNGTRVSIARNVRSRDLSGTIMASTSATFSTQWYEVVADWLASGLINVNVYNPDGSLFKSVSTTTSASDAQYYTSGGIGFGFFNQHGGWDSVMVKPYTAITPTYINGPEQVSGGATWQAKEDATLSGLLPGTNVRLRFSIQNTGTAQPSQIYQLEVAPKGGALNCGAVSTGNFTPVPTQSTCVSSGAVACMTSSTQFTDQSSTTPLMSYPSNLNFTYGKIMQDPSHETSGVNVLSLPANTATEVEYNFQVTASASQNTYCFRVNNDPSDLNNYDKVADVTISHPPFLSNLQLNNSSNITLTEGTTTTIYATATSTDFNGYTDMVSATSTIYRNGVGPDCTPDNNNCYKATCSFQNCSGNSCDVSCRSDIYYFADPTDPGSQYYGQQGWRARMSVVDSTNLRDTQTTLASSTDLLTLRALEVTSGALNYSNPTLNGGTGLYPGQDTGGFNATTTTKNTGNTNIDVQVGAETGGLNTIPVGTQKFATTTFVYSSCSICTSLTGASNRAGVNIAKPTSTTTPQTTSISFGISIPNGTTAGTLTGVNDFSAVGPSP